MQNKLLEVGKNAGGRSNKAAKCSLKASKCNFEADNEEKEYSSCRYNLKAIKKQLKSNLKAIKKQFKSNLEAEKGKKSKKIGNENEGTNYV